MPNVDLQCPLVSLEHKKPGNRANFSGWDFIRNTSGQIQEENTNCNSVSDHCKQSWAPRLQETCQPLGFSLPPTKQDFTQQSRAVCARITLSGHSLQGDIPGELVPSFQRSPAALLSSCRSPWKVFCGDQRGRNLAAEP